MRQLSYFLSAGTVAFCAVFLVSSSAHGTGQVQASITPSNAVEQVVEQADNAYVGVFTPLSQTSSSIQGAGSEFGVGSSAFSADASEFTSNFAVPIGSQSLEVDTLNGSTGNASGNSIALSNGWNGATTSELAFVNPNELLSRNQVLINSLFAPSAASQILTTASNINAEEASLWKSGLSSCSAQDCTITGAAGAVVTSFDSVSIGSTSATVVATETLWQDDGGISPLTGVFTWTRSQGTYTSTDQLELSATGNWLVISHDLSLANGA